MVSLVTIVRRTLLGVAVACIGYFGFATAYSHLGNASASRDLDRMIRQYAAGERPVRRAGLAPADGALLGRIEIPHAGVSTVVLEGTEDRWLLVAAGHVKGTSLPGEDGNVVLAGHRDSFFRGLRHLKRGDVVTLTVPSRQRFYAVESMEIVDPHARSVMQAGGSSRLTLITCYPFGYVGRAPKRYVVTARLMAEGTGVARPLPGAPVG